MIYLPRVIEEDCVRAQPQAAVASRKRSATILLVEDQQELRMLLREVLRSTGHTVITTASGAEAIEAVRAGQERIDLLITDIVMPGMRGWELARRLKSAHPKLKVLYISGHTDTDLINDGALRAGDILLEKPFRPDSLLNKVDEVLGQVEKEEMAAQAKRA
jgi:CheY-like chemotaxis protein